ncbi:related to Retrograde regulation protein 1 [Nakaseomyces glabratus]|nr:Helix-loop-helix DNA-binding domain [Nakaseomyces glabratus]QNG12739.1 RTG1 [Nakaseomyces glabratus]SCV17209.1 related to Retrograde regulation protein 1 [Nakaseomyces glabratus]SLM17006.1 related to Retrograde regulation protein 1 [Nakaseomyces glabratus]
MSTPISQSVPSSSGQMKAARKRNDNMTDKIQELLRLIPAEFFQESYGSGNESGANGETPGPASGAPKLKGTGTKDGRPNKGQILTQAVEYISHLQNQVDSYNREEIELMVKVTELAKETGTIVNDINLENTSAEIALANIGVGPLAAASAGDETQDQNSESKPNSSVSSSVADEENSRGTPKKAQMSKFEYGGYAEYAS